MLDEGMSQRKICEEVGCSKGTVTNIKKTIEAGCQKRQVGENGSPEVDEELDELVGTDEELEQEEKEVDESAARFQAQLRPDEDMSQHKIANEVDYCQRIVSNASEQKDQVRQIAQNIRYRTCESN